MPVANISKISDTRLKAEVNPSAEEMSIAEQKALAKLQQKVTLPGFRKGKAPLHLVKQKYGADVLEDTLRNAVAESLPDIEKKAEQRIFEIIEIGDLNQKDKSFTFSVTFDVMPHLKLGKLKEAQLKEHIAEISESDVQKEIKDILTRVATFEEKADAIAEENDELRVDFEIWVDGAPSGEIEKDFKFRLGKGTLHAELEKKIIEGKGKVDQEFSFKKEAEGEGDRRRAGYEIFCTIRGIGKPVLPELTDPWVTENRKPLTTVAEFKAKVKETLEKRFRVTNIAREVDRAIEALHKVTQFFIPDSYIERYVTEFLAERKADRAQVPPDVISDLGKRYRDSEERVLLTRHLLKLAGDANKDKAYHDSLREFVKAELSRDKAPDQPGEGFEDIIMKMLDEMLDGKELDKMWTDILNSYVMLFNQQYLAEYFRSEGLVKKGKKLSFADLITELKSEK